MATYFTVTSTINSDFDHIFFLNMCDACIDFNHQLMTLMGLKLMVLVGPNHEFIL